jgi:adenine-specific DNA-methyltransferase
MALKKAGFAVHANDHLSFAHCIATCYLQADREVWWEKGVALVEELRKVPPLEGYFTETFCKKSRFLQPKNGARIDGIRERIEEMDLEPELRAIALTSLMEAADRVDSTTGVHMAYLKQWAARASNDLELRMPELLPRARSGLSFAHCLEAVEAAEIEVDLAYLDPPYNQHSYLGNYHIWESLVRWDKPSVYGVACKREDCRSRKSLFNSKPRAFQALKDVVQGLCATYLVLSFNDEGYIDRHSMESLLASRGEVLVFEKEHPRYVGAQIGIHDLQGKKVGTVGNLKNRELLYVGLPLREVDSFLGGVNALVASGFQVSPRSR